MFDPSIVEKLAGLSRIELSEGEKVALAGDLERIVAYVSQVTKASAEVSEPMKAATRNVLREDGEPHASGAFSEKLLAQAPGTVRNLVKVKKIIAQD